MAAAEAWTVAAMEGASVGSEDTEAAVGVAQAQAQPVVAWLPLRDVE